MKFLLSILVLAVALVAAPSTLSAQAAPVTATLNPGDPATFTVTVAGTQPFTYQWFKDGVAIAGATANPFRIASLTPADAASYTAKVTNSAGSTTSPAAVLVVTNPPVVTGITVEKK
jgi:hypothetical protein